MTVEQAEKTSIAEGERPRWQIWALIAVLLGCIGTVAATLYDIA
ncbi:MAG: hypothetical protein ABR588_04870 [Sphingomicrobium sp.]